MHLIKPSSLNLYSEHKTLINAFKNIHLYIYGCVFKIINDLCSIKKLITKEAVMCDLFPLCILNEQKSIQIFQQAPKHSHTTEKQPCP